jgi:ankyrin repeat protein
VTTNGEKQNGREDDEDITERDNTTFTKNLFQQQAPSPEAAFWADYLLSAVLDDRRNLAAALLTDVPDTVFHRKSLNNALMAAASRGRFELIRELIAKGANVNSRNRQGKTPLMKAASLGRVQTIELLIEAGANLDAVHVRGGTALMKAASRGRTEAVKCLLAAGANSGMKDRNGSTAADYALMAGAHEAYKLLNLGSPEETPEAPPSVHAGATQSVEGP